MRRDTWRRLAGDGGKERSRDLQRREGDMGVSADEPGSKWVSDR